MEPYVKFSSWWSQLHAYLVEDKYASTTVTSTLAFTVYWSLGLFYVILAITGKPAFLHKYKVQPITKNAAKQIKKRLPRLVFQVLFNQTFVSMPILLAACTIMQSRDHFLDPVLPTIQEVLMHLCIFAVLDEIGFYYSHRLLHHPVMYKKIHKKHHEWNEPIAVTALYCHPLEQAMSNMIPVLWGPLSVNSHIVTLWIWIAMVIQRTLIDHSGYHFPFCKSPQGHDYHHLKFNQFYGILGILDWIHGTDKAFRSSKQFKNHKFLMSFQPLPQHYDKSVEVEDGKLQ